MFSKTFVLSLLFIAFTFFTPVHSQKKSPKNPDKKKEVTTGLKDHLFNSDEMLHFTLTGKLNTLYNDRYKNIAYHPMLLQLTGKDSASAMKLSVKTRGNFRRRRENCKMPPLMLNFPRNESTKGSPFENQRKLKLVVPCQGNEYVVREYLIYKLYNLLSERSFKARLAQVDFVDSAGKKSTETHYCFLLEDEN